jgi:hypothetical protein
MSPRSDLIGGQLTRKGEAKPPPEPGIRRGSPPYRRRVGTSLPHGTYIRFKAKIARDGVTGEQAIRVAIERMLRDG